MIRTENHSRSFRFHHYVSLLCDVSNDRWARWRFEPLPLVQNWECDTCTMSLNCLENLQETHVKQLVGGDNLMCQWSRIGGRTFNLKLQGFFHQVPRDYPWLQITEDANGNPSSWFFPSHFWIHRTNGIFFLRIYHKHESNVGKICHTLSILGLCEDIYIIYIWYIIIYVIYICRIFKLHTNFEENHGWYGNWSHIFSTLQPALPGGRVPSVDLWMEQSKRRSGGREPCLDVPGSK